MEVKEAVALAKRYVRDVFSDEELSNIGLEEIVYDDASNTWDVTVGFSRPWDSKSPFASALLGPSLPRSYKVVRISDTDGKMLSVRNRQTQA
jgi:hypothetical protein